MSNFPISLLESRRRVWPCSCVIINSVTPPSRSLSAGSLPTVISITAATSDCGLWLYQR